MFARHRSDLKEAHAQEVAALRMVIEVLAEQVEYLRAKLDGHGFVSARAVAVNPTAQPPAEPGVTGYLSEEEEDLLALHLNGHLDDAELQSLQAQLGLRGDLHADDF